MNSKTITGYIGSSAANHLDQIMTTEVSQKDVTIYFDNIARNRGAKKDWEFWEWPPVQVKITVTIEALPGKKGLNHD